MQGIVHSETRFEKPASGWAKFRADDVRFQSGLEGLLLSAEKDAATLNGPGVHTRNGTADREDRREGKPGQICEYAGCAV